MRVVDETGKQYGFLTVLERAGSISGKAAWKCQCECGAIVICTGDSLRRHNRTSCGHCYIKAQRCSEIGKLNKKDLTNQKFGKLTVVREALSNELSEIQKNNKGIYWKCQCECGNTHIVETSNLTQGRVLSCGCLISKGEWKIKQILEKYHICYHSQYTQENFLLSTFYHPYFDFALFNKNQHLVCLIEYHGEQHYYYSKSKKSWNNYENFVKCQHRDSEKRELCKKFNIKLYEISYLKFDKLDKIIYNILKEQALL